jgi:predicted negative regulator of RcsB-dependent stress response
VSSTEDEHLADFKDWWSRNGKPLVTGGLLALVIVFGWQAFQKYQSNQSQGASMLYQQLLETTLTPDGKPDAAVFPTWRASSTANSAAAPMRSTAACSWRKSPSTAASSMTQPAS